MPCSLRQRASGRGRRRGWVWMACPERARRGDGLAMLHTTHTCWQSKLRRCRVAVRQSSLGLQATGIKYFTSQFRVTAILHAVLRERRQYTFRAIHTSSTFRGCRAIEQRMFCAVCDECVAIVTQKAQKISGSFVSNVGLGINQG